MAEEHNISQTRKKFTVDLSLEDGKPGEIHGSHSTISILACVYTVIGVRSF